MTMKKTILLACLLLLPLSSWAQGNQGAGQTYVIKKGDTLWGISQRFLQDPDYWPDLWANNPFIRNPHFIYPGQKVAIYDGRIEIVPTRPKAPETHPAPKPVPPKPQEQITIKSLGGSEGFVGEDGLASAGRLVDTVDNRLLMATGDTVFLQMNDLAAVHPGDRYSLVQIGKEVIHPVSGKVIGRQVTPVGTVKITAVDADVATAVITTAYREIQRGARVIPYHPAARKIALKKATRSLSGTLVASQRDQIVLAQWNVIYIDLGSQDGLEVGNLLNLSRPRKATERALQGKEIQLPDTLVGSAVVLKTEAHTASALVLKSVAPIYRGDRVSTVTK